MKDRRGDGYIITVPGADFRSGDFSSQIARAVVYDPATGNKDTGAGRTPFAGNIIPDNRISPIAKKILGFVPLPNLGSGLTNNYASQTTRSKDTNSFDVKVDHSQTDNDRFSARYSFQRPVVTDPGRFGIYGGGGKGFAATGINRVQSTAVNYTHVFSPTLVSEFRAGLSRYSNKAQNLDYGTRRAQTLGIPGANLDDWSSGLSLDERRRLREPAGRLLRQPAVEPRRDQHRHGRQLDQDPAQPHDQVRRGPAPAAR